MRLNNTKTYTYFCSVSLIINSCQDRTTVSSQHCTMTSEKWTAEGHSTDCKMDLPRALTIMGFKTTAAFEGQSYEQRKSNLDQNHSKRMHEIQVGVLVLLCSS